MNGVAKKATSVWIARLKSLREFYGLDQAEAASRINAPLGTWRNWEQGRRVPSPMIVKLLELAFPEFFKKK